MQECTTIRKVSAKTVARKIRDNTRASVFSLDGDGQHSLVFANLPYSHPQKCRPTLRRKSKRKAPAHCPHRSSVHG